MKQGQDNLYSSDIQVLELLQEDKEKNPNSLLENWAIGYPKKDVSNNTWSIEVAFSNSDFKSSSNDSLIYDSITTLRFSTKCKKYKYIKSQLDACIKYVLKLILSSELLAPKRPKMLTDKVEIKQYYDPTSRIVRFGFREDYDFNYSDEKYKVLLKNYEIGVEENEKEEEHDSSWG